MGILTLSALLNTIKIPVNGYDSGNTIMYDHILQLFDLHDKVAMVTGGAGWLGAAISQALAQCGASVSIIDINKDAIETIVNTIKEQGLLASGRVADVMKDISLRACIDDVAADQGRFDILVNCAYKGPVPRLDEVQFEAMDEGLHNGASAYCIAAQQAVKHMRKNGGGTIINIASMYGMVTGYPSVYEGLASPTSIVYQASKAAVIQMTRYMAVF